jgi:WD40 repeat protein
MLLANLSSKAIRTIGLPLLLLVPASLLESPAFSQSLRPATLIIRSLSFSPDGRFLAVCRTKQGGGAVELWDMASRNRIWIQQEPAGFVRVRFAPSGKTLAAATGKEDVQILNSTDGKATTTLSGSGPGIQSLAFSPDSKFLAVAGTDPAIRVWNLETGFAERTLEDGKTRWLALAFSSDGKTLASSRTGGVNLWDIATGQVRTKLAGHLYAPNTLLFARDGSALLMATADASIFLWDIATNREVMALQNRGGVMGMVYDPKRSILATCSLGGEIELFDLPLKPPSEAQTKRIDVLLKQLDDDRYTVREAAEAGLLKIGFAAQAALHDADEHSPSVEVRIRSRRIRSKILSTPRAILTGDAERVRCLDCCPATGVLASAGTDGLVRLWDIEKAKEIGRLVLDEK